MSLIRVWLAFPCNYIQTGFEGLSHGKLEFTASPNGLPTRWEQNLHTPPSPTRPASSPLAPHSLCLRPFALAVPTSPDFSFLAPSLNLGTFSHRLSNHLRSGPRRSFTVCDLPKILEPCLLPPERTRVRNADECFALWELNCCPLRRCPLLTRGVCT